MTVSLVVKRCECTPDPNTKKVLNKLEDRQASIIAQAILQQAVGARISYYQHEFATISPAIHQKVWHLFSKHIPTNREFIPLTRAEVQLLSFDQLKELRTEFTYHNPSRFLLIEGSDFGIPLHLEPPNDPKQLIPDFKIKHGEKAFWIHSYLFTRISHYFSALTSSNLMEQGLREADLTEATSEEDLMILIQHIYGYPMEINKKEFFALAKCAEYFQIPSLDDFLAESRYLSSIIVNDVYKRYSGLSTCFSHLKEFRKIAPSLENTMDRLLPGIDRSYSEPIDIKIESKLETEEWKALTKKNINKLVLNWIYDWDKREFDYDEANLGIWIALMKLQELHITHCDFRLKEFLKNVSFSKTLKKLTLEEYYLTPETGQVIAEMPLKSLSISIRYDLNEEFSILLAQSRTLEEIDLMWTTSLQNILPLLSIKTLKKLELVESDIDKQAIIVEAEKNGVELKWKKRSVQ